MIEVLTFVFSSFWHWLGTVVLILSIGGSLSMALPTMRIVWSNGK